MSTRSLRRAVEANLTALYVMLSRWPELDFHRDDNRIWTISRRQFSLCNVVLETRFDAADIREQIERVLHPYLGLNINVMWKLGPSSRPAELAGRLAEHGFLALPTLHGMALDLTALGSLAGHIPELEVREVDDVESLNLWRRAVERGFGWPGYAAKDIADSLEYFLRTRRTRRFAAYVGIIDGEPAASSLVFFDAEIAGIYFVSTVPELRRRGLGFAITAMAVMEARRRGCKAAILHATEMGFPVYRRLGFEEVCPIQMCLRRCDT